MKKRHAKRWKKDLLRLRSSMKNGRKSEGRQETGKKKELERVQVKLLRDSGRRGKERVERQWC